MKKREQDTSAPLNVLHDLHSRMINLPIHFRERICAECAWSVPTFYRKMRTFTKATAGTTDKEKITPVISNAEAEKIIEVVDELYKGFYAYCEKYRKKGGK
jgi:hypothetical protein